MRYNGDCSRDEAGHTGQITLIKPYFAIPMAREAAGPGNRDGGFPRQPCAAQKNRYRTKAAEGRKFCLWH